MTKRYQTILKDPLYCIELQKLAKFEKNRRFCRHTMEHFLDVARIMYILSLEAQTTLSKDIIYATALLHDIGRAQEYENGTPHNEASVTIATCILSSCDYNDDEIQQITSAIDKHRTETSKTDCLSAYLYQADKLSRNCFTCPAYEECYWPTDKKNHTIYM